MTDDQLERIHDAIQHLMDEAGEYILVEDLAFILGRSFHLVDDDGIERTITPQESWLATYDGPNPDLWDVIEASPAGRPRPDTLVGEAHRILRRQGPEAVQAWWQGLSWEQRAAYVAERDQRRAQRHDQLDAANSAADEEREGPS